MRKYVSHWGKFIFLNKINVLKNKHTISKLMNNIFIPVLIFIKYLFSYTRSKHILEIKCVTYNFILSSYFLYSHNNFLKKLKESMLLIKLCC